MFAVLPFVLTSCNGGDDALESPKTPNSTPNPSDPTSVVTLKTAGTLKSLLGDNYLDFNSLKVIGPINGNDIYCIREMIGGSPDELIRGNLSNLDLSEASIVEGGSWYRDYYDVKLYATENTIGKDMFSDCPILRNIVLPNNLTTIDEYAFYASKITSITIGDNLTLVDEFAFDNCLNLNSVYISDMSVWCRIKWCSEYANPMYHGDVKLYLNNKEITELTVPSNITEINDYAFLGYNYLTKIKFHNGVTKIGSSAFEDCSSLTSVTIPNGISHIENRTFYGCSNLEEITIPGSVTQIGEAAFGDCSSLTSITIPNGVSLIDNYSFSGCSSLVECYCYATIPPELGTDIFGFPTGSNEVKPILYVPSGCKSAYENSDWSDCVEDIIEMN